jgi:predicted dehydrogenase
MDNIAVLGLGSIGLRHAANLISLGASVVGFDPNPERHALLRDLGGTVATSRDMALHLVDAAVIATPNRYHVQDLTACLRARRPCFIEKPLAHTAAEPLPLIEEAEKLGLLIFPGMNLRFHPAVMAAHSWLAEGYLGRLLWGDARVSLFLPDYRPGSDYRNSYAADPKTGGVIFDDIHEIDLICHLLGPASLLAASACNTGTLGIAAEDMSNLVLRHHCGAVSSVHLDFVTKPRLRRCDIAGIKGRLSLDLDGRRAVLLDVSGAVLEDITFPGSYAEDHKAQIAAFLNCLRTGSPSPCPPKEALQILELSLTARQCAGLPQP